ncbi:helix-turn-helix transcriptional regulator [Ruficoccus amylovorans]|uniref:Helix-turn-helix transcriptional regulator n=1 Tax=Ruficoccus amylovorans TaxID=1804625 RepID=A0A842H8R9_9BACT|nr:AraC family transcriptional regulator [Ruficoccus amylovorans]MBC2592923.1 helix-turn-helix transcriptional regulator [Ruficoccus amylovorans]
MKPASLLQFRDWSSLHADLAWVYKGSVPDEFRKRHCPSDFLGAWLVLEGSVRVSQRHREVCAAPGDWLIMAQNEGYQEFSEGAQILSIRYCAEWPDRKPFFELGLPLIMRGADHPELELRAQELRVAVEKVLPPVPTELQGQSVNLSSFIAVRAKFWEWFGELYEALSGRGISPTRVGIQDERVSQMVHYLDHLELSERVRESDLARLAGLSTAYFVRLFRDEVGVTPKRYFDERRRDACRRLLGAADIPIKEISYNLGFTRLSDFSAWFSDEHGVSPRKYRELEQARGD